MSLNILQVVGIEADKGGEVVQANADRAYDTNDNFEFLKAHNIILAIKIRKNVESGRLRSPQRTQRVEKILNLLSYLSALAV